MSASISTTLTAGTYTLFVDGVGYGDPLNASNLLTLSNTGNASNGAALTVSQDWTVGSAILTTAPGVNGVYHNFDGSALDIATNVDTEGEAVSAGLGHSP